MIRVNISAMEVDKKGFTLKVATWGDTLVWSITATWFAYEKGPATIQGDCYRKLFILL